MPVDNSRLFMIKAVRPRRAGQRRGKVFMYIAVARHTDHAISLVKQNGFQMEMGDVITCHPLGSKVALHASYSE